MVDRAVVVDRGVVVDEAVTGDRGHLRQRRLLSDDVFRALRDAVLEGVLEPGERLRDDELVRWLGVSRTPIRNALDRLRSAGLVDLAANRWTRVRDPDCSTLGGSASVVAALHRAAAVIAFPRLDDPAVDVVAAGLRSARPVVRRGAAGPASIEVLRCVAVAVGGVAALAPVGVLAASFAEAELRLAHELRSRRCVVDLSAWDDFDASAGRALAARDGGAWGDAVGQLLHRVAATGR
ncbi:GntR family transcriptional regulator [Frigoribacterium sp. ACAM 257]|nr:GntR family transcriptional regulator [Frigoribacterium sp. ACAM 257]